MFNQLFLEGHRIKTTKKLKLLLHKIQNSNNKTKEEKLHPQIASDQHKMIKSKTQE